MKSITLNLFIYFPVQFEKRLRVENQIFKKKQDTRRNHVLVIGRKIVFSIVPGFYVRKYPTMYIGIFRRGNV